MNRVETGFLVGAAIAGTSAGTLIAADLTGTNSQRENDLLAVGGLAVVAGSAGLLAYGLAASARGSSLGLVGLGLGFAASQGAYFGVRALLD